MIEWPKALRVRTIGAWPGARTPAGERRDSQFRASLSDTISLLRRELAAIKATDIWLEIAIHGDPESNPAEWRQDGRPRASARPDHPGVVIVFRSPVAPEREMRVATDRFRSWEDNLRAIALTLAHQRAFERYGTATRGEQYVGWAQLPSPHDAVVERGRQLIREHGNARAALMAVHPDRGGSTEDAAAVNAAVAADRAGAA